MRRTVIAQTKIHIAQEIVDLIDHLGERSTRFRRCERFRDRIARYISGGVAAHPVGDGPQAEIGTREHRVFVAFAPITWMRLRRGGPAILHVSPRVAKADDRVGHQRLTEADPTGTPQSAAASMQIENCLVFAANERAVAALVEQPERLTPAHNASVMTRSKRSDQLDVAAFVPANAIFRAVRE